jgi:hypothetical protein
MLAGAKRVLVVVCALGLVDACAGGTVVEDDSGQGGSPSTVAATGGAAGSGGSSSLCEVDCSTIATPQCLQSVCNDGSYPGVVGDCVVVPSPMGESCDDDLFCTVDDSCDGTGVCMGGPENDCGMTPEPCREVDCVEASMSCTEIPAMNGAPCQDPQNLCLKGSTCNAGNCIGGTIDDCFFFPVPDDCHVATCNPMTGMCEAMVGNEGLGCIDQMDLCTVNKTCAAGMCQGGIPKDCSGLTMGCFDGVCDLPTGNCVQQPIMPGQQCAEATDQCNVGICDTLGNCNATPANQGMPCDDFIDCTTGDICLSGTCTPQGTITQCINNDTCCPSSCSQTTDNDCQFLDVGLAAGPGSCLTTNGPFNVLQTVLQNRGHTATFVQASAIDTLPEITAFDVIVLTGPGDPCSIEQYAQYDAVIASYVQGGGGLVGSGWLLYSSYLSSSPNIVAMIPTILASNYQSGPGIATPVGNHPITVGLSQFNWNQWLPWGGGTKTGATTLLTANSNNVGAAWQQGAGRAVYLGPMFVEGYNAYDNENLLNGTQFNSVELFARAIEWAGGAL